MARIDVPRDSGTSPAPSTAGKSDRKVRTTGAVTLNSTAWADVDAGLDLTLTGVSAGQWVEVWLQAFPDTGAVALYLDAVSVVAGAPAKTWSTFAAEAAGGQGVATWAAKASDALGRGGPVARPLEAGDIDANGNVTIRLRYRTSAATARQLYGTATLPLMFGARVLG